MCNVAYCGVDRLSRWRAGDGGSGSGFGPGHEMRSGGGPGYGRRLGQDLAVVVDRQDGMLSVTNRHTSTQYVLNHVWI